MKTKDKKPEPAVEWFRQKQRAARLTEFRKSLQEK